MNGFATFWAHYPRKVAKVAAERAYKRAAKRFGDDTIIHALDAVVITWSRRKPEFIPYPATWLNATDFDDEFEARTDDPAPMLPLTVRNQHLCTFCPDPHWWDCDDELCGAGSRLACKAILQKIKDSSGMSGKKDTPSSGSGSV